MTIIVTWSPQSGAALECAPAEAGEELVVKTVHWLLTASDGTSEAMLCGSQPIPRGEGGGFTPFDELTLDQVMGWVHGAMGPERAAAAELRVTSDLAALALTPPVVAVAPPWEG